MKRRLEGKVVVVAGGGGIGDGLAARYCAEGASVVLGDVDPSVAERAAEKIAAEGGRIVAIALDGADEDAIIAGVARAQSEFGGLHGFHANFSSFADSTNNDDVLSLPLEAFDEMMRVNARGFFLCTRHAVPAMIASGGGTMLYTSAGGAYMGERVRVAYAMSKAAGHALARHVATASEPMASAPTLSPPASSPTRGSTKQRSRCSKATWPRRRSRSKPALVGPTTSLGSGRC